MNMKCSAFLAPVSVSFRSSIHVPLSPRHAAVRPVLSPPTRLVCALPALPTLPALPVLPPLPTTVTTVLTAASAAATPFAIWTILLTAATLGLTSQSTRWGAALSPPLVSTITTVIFSNLNLLPPVHPIYTSVTTFIVPLAIPLLLLGADLRRVFRETGRLLTVFIVGTIATCIGTFVAWYAVPLTSLGDSAWKIAAALTARHIGGAVNYIAVADATGAPPDVVTAALTADNLVVALYFMVLLVLARNLSQPPIPKGTIPAPAQIVQPKLPQDEDVTSASAGTANVSIADAGVAVSLSAAMCSFAAFISKLLPISLGVIPVTTAIVLVAATFFRDVVRPYRRAAATVGVFFMQIFFAVAGAGGSFLLVMRRAPVIFMWCSVQLAVHLAVLMLSGIIFKFHRAEVLITSNANVGGPSTAAAMASSKNWDRLVVPALLVGVFGYSIATFVSLGLGYGVLRLL